MCGICGWVSLERPPDPAIVQAMTDRMVHRGPDAGAVQTFGQAVLGHRRLAVIDLSTAANQPFSDPDGRFSMVFNGEIYNYREIRRELSAAGVAFRTQSDTEVVLESYRRWGTAFVDHLNGMFALAVWDSRDRRLVLARDRAGEKPLYYAESGHGLAFASELTALLAVPWVERRLDPAALGEYLSAGYVCGPRTMIVGIRQLPPAHLLVVEPGRPLRPQRYWDLAAHFRHKRTDRSEAEAAEELRALIDDAVALRLVADVPVGAFLSGGIDSATIVAAMGRQLPSERILTFSAGFREKGFSEVPEAASMARWLGVCHSDQTVEPDMAATLGRIVRFGDVPLADTSLIPCYFLAEFARRRVTVALSGDGGDELLAGYETCVADRWRHWSRSAPLSACHGLVDSLLPVSHGKVSFPYKIRQFLRGHALSAPRAHWFWRTLFDEAEKRSLIDADWSRPVLDHDPFEPFGRAFAEVEDLAFLDQSLYVDIKTWLPDDILVKVDRATMAHSLESRAPFLDHRLMEFAAGLPVDWKLKKYLLKQSQRGRLPPAVLKRPKKGFNAPVSHWFAGPLRELGRAVTLESGTRDWFDRAVVTALWEEHETGRRDNGLKLFALTCLGLWHDQTLAGQSQDMAGGRRT